MRLFLFIFALFAIACKNSPSDGSTVQSSGDSTEISTYKYTFNDTILVSIYPRDFYAVTKSKPNMPILDFRPEEDYKIQGHIWRAVSMDASKPDFHDRLVKMSRTQEYAVCCMNGVQSFTIAEEMKRLGFKRIYHLRTGIQNWGETQQALQLN